MRSIALLGLAAVALAAPAAAQRDTVVVAGPEYRAGPLKRALLGSAYRDLWTAPVRVPFLDLGTFAGGLTPTEMGGGNQTTSLRFRGADGREYAFRSAAKTPGRQVGGAGPAGYFVKDQVSSQLPAPGVAAARLTAASGALHVVPALYVMPDDPRLGEFRERFAGMLGQIEERPEDGFAGSDDEEGTDDFLEEIEESPRDRVDARELLRVRMVDLVLGDWDRHEGQYGWARFDGDDGVRLWRPIPRDRDYAFVAYDGLLLGLVRPMFPKLVRFSPRIGDPYGLIEQGQFLDRRLLGELERPAWDSAAAQVRARMTDEMIDDALAHLPAEYRARRGAELAAALRARRDELPVAAAAFYRMMAREPEVYGTDEDEVASIVHTRDGVEVRLHLPGAGDRPHFRRRFHAGETREVRVFLHGGDDRATVTGSGPVLVRVIGGGGDDRLEDRGTARAVFYDDRGDNVFLHGPRTVVDQRSYESPEWVLGANDGSSAPRDWGTRVSALAPFAALRPHAGVVLGAGPRRTRYGFRRHPDAVDGWARVLWSPLRGRFGVEARHQRRRTGSDDVGYLFGRASELEAVAFRGFGNDVPSRRGERAVVLWERQLLAEGGLVLPRDGGWTYTLAGILRFTDSETPPPFPGARPRGAGGEWLAGGARAGVALDRRDTLAFTRRGWTAEATGAVFPLHLAHRDAGVFGRAGAVATAYLPLGTGPVLAARAGGEAAWGEYPVQYAVFLGNAATVRGLGEQRYAGDRSLYGTVEVRQPLGGSLGVFALADAGRVWHDGRSDGGWHTALGAGAWAGARGQGVTLTVAYGEVPIFYLGFGLPF